MRELLKLNEEELLFFDIETAPIVKELIIDTPLYDSWEYKVNKDKSLDSSDVIKHYKENAAIYPEFAKVICIVVGVIHNDEILIKTFNQKNEKDILNSFNETLENPKNTKKRLVGFYNIGFDTPFIFKRMLINGIKPHDKIDSSGLKVWEVEEIDLGKLWCGNSFSKASLINVSTSFGLPSPKNFLDGSMVSSAYYKGDIDLISNYCKNDVITTINVFRKMCLKEPLVYNESAVDTTKAPPLIEDLFNGGKYTLKKHNTLLEFLKTLTKDEQEKCFVLLDSISSNAKGKVTSLTKDHIKKLKQSL